MEAIGGVASAIALAQVAISLAQALNTYVGAVSDSVDDIVIIADDISDTFGNLKQLATVLEKNEKTQLLNAEAIDNAQRCIKRSDLLLKRLRKLFEKSSGSINSGQIVSEQIDINKFRKGMWIIYKSEFELRRAELHHIKADISLVYLTYLAMASGSEGMGKQQAVEQMKLVYAKRNVLDKKVKKARQRRDRDTVSQRVRATDDPDSIDDDEEEPAAVYTTIEDLYSEFDAWLMAKEKREQEAIAEKEATEREAVEKYLNIQKEAALQMQTEMERLRSTLAQHSLPPQRIDQIVRDAYPQLGSAQQLIFNNTPAEKRNSITVGPAGENPPLSASSWFRRPSKLPYMTPVTSNVNNKIPEMYRDASAPHGVAQLKGLYFQRLVLSPQRHEIVKMDVAVPDFHMMPNLWTAVSQSSQHSGASTFFQGFIDVPEDYRYHITKEIELLREKTGVDWMVLQIEAVRSEQRIRRFSLRHRSEVIGVCVVLRKVASMESLYDQEERIPNRNTKDNSDATPPVREATSTKVPVSQRELSRESGQSIAEYQPVLVKAESTYINPKKDAGPESLIYTSNSRRAAESQPRRTRFAEDVVTIPVIVPSEREVPRARARSTAAGAAIPPHSLRREIRTFGRGESDSYSTNPVILQPMDAYDQSSTRIKHRYRHPRRRGTDDTETSYRERRRVSDSDDSSYVYQRRTETPLPQVYHEPFFGSDTGQRYDDKGRGPPIFHKASKQPFNTDPSTIRVVSPVRMQSRSRSRARTYVFESDSESGGYQNRARIIDDRYPEESIVIHNHLSLPKTARSREPVVEEIFKSVPQRKQPTYIFDSDDDVSVYNEVPTISRDRRSVGRVFKRAPKRANTVTMSDADSDSPGVDEISIPPLRADMSADVAVKELLSKWTNPDSIASRANGARPNVADDDEVEVIEDHSDPEIRPGRANAKESIELNDANRVTELEPSPPPTRSNGVEGVDRTASTSTRGTPRRRSYMIGKE